MGILGKNVPEVWDKIPLYYRGSDPLFQLLLGVLVVSDVTERRALGTGVTAGRRPHLRREAGEVLRRQAVS